MSIQYDEKTRQFHLHNGGFSYIIKILENGFIGQVYCGAALDPGRAYPLLAPVPFPGFSNNSGDGVRFEYPLANGGDFRVPALVPVFADGSELAEPVYQAHRIYKGKEAIPGLPSTYVEDDDEADTLEIDLLDGLSGLQVTLYYTLFAAWPCLARRTAIRNGGRAPLTLSTAMSLSLDLPDADWDLLSLTGAWGREFHITGQPLRMGLQGLQSSRGISGHQQNPFLLLKRPQTTSFEGEALGLSLIYSGNFTAQAEVDSFGLCRLRIGINPDTFAWELAPGAVFHTPEAVLTWSGGGIDRLSAAFHGLYRSRLARGFWRDRDRPVLLNNWEGTYFNFTETKLLEMASCAKDLGVELFVLDDGWFGKRDADNCSLGDWYADKRKLPGGIPGLAKKINALGLQFGLWIEPEMLSEDSNLYRAHPGWAVGAPGRKHIEARRQMVLDMGRPEVVDYLYDLLKELIGSAPISYIKWDMNRSITEGRRGEFFHRYVLGVYDLYGRLTAAFPEILFESCCSGGGRFDPGILAYAPQGWLSDDSDGLERLFIQTGASMVYPQSSLGCHVSAVPNHQTGRVTPIMFRAMTAFFGVLGYELDPTKLKDEEKQAVKTQIAFYKAHRGLFQRGKLTRLWTTGRGDYAAWMVSSPDRSEAVVGFYRMLNHPNRQARRLPLRDLDPAARYELALWVEGGFGWLDGLCNCGKRGGDELMNAGLLVDTGQWPGDFVSELFLLRKIV
ncbi:MAG: alpha-galactosidase [Treponema sp.]|jgi:alpha-galactosidase|nr:alpha-galactosidase [Treponema sp.]